MIKRPEGWKRVEPGYVIPAGQPYRVEYSDQRPEWLPPSTKAVDVDGNLVSAFRPVEHGLFVETSRWFIDSSWKPPLVLPTEPTWGIAVVMNDRDEDLKEWIVDRWVLTGRKYTNELTFEGYHTASSYEPKEVLNWVPLTHEQTKQLEDK